MVKNRFEKIIWDKLKHTPLHDLLYPLVERKIIRDWEKQGRPFPLPAVYKQKVIKEYAKEFATTIFIETGTAKGDTTFVLKNCFRRIYSIELSKTLYEKAKIRFSRYKKISILFGDSAEVLPKIIQDISCPCLFWLDAHYSGIFSGELTARGEQETPIKQELMHILNHPIENHVILIDDAHEYIGKNDYPTLEELKGLVFSKHPDFVFEVKHDIIRIHKQEKLV